MTDMEIMYHRFQRDHIKKHTGVLAEMLGMSRRDYEAAVRRGMDEEARELAESKARQEERAVADNPFMMSEGQEP